MCVKIRNIFSAALSDSENENQDEKENSEESDLGTVYISTLYFSKI